MRQFLRQIIVLNFLLLPLYAMAASAEAAANGEVTGARMSVHPIWFKESFLEISLFADVMEYLCQRRYEKYPDSVWDYVDASTERLVAAGQNVSLSDERVAIAGYAAANAAR